MCSRWLALPETIALAIQPGTNKPYRPTTLPPEDAEPTDADEAAPVLDDGLGGPTRPMPVIRNVAAAAALATQLGPAGQPGLEGSTRRMGPAPGLAAFASPQRAEREGSGQTAPAHAPGSPGDGDRAPGAPPADSGGPPEDRVTAWQSGNIAGVRHGTEDEEDEGLGAGELDDFFLGD